MRLKKWSLSGIIMPVIAGTFGSIFLGRIALIEILALAWLLLAGGYRNLPLLFKKSYSFIGLFYFSSAALILSDIINQTSLENAAKGAGAYALFPTTVLFLLTVFNKDQLWLLLFSSYVAGIFTNPIVAEYGFSQDAFKFGFSSAAVFSILTLTLLSRYFSLPFLNKSFWLSIVSSLSILVLGLWGNLRLLALCAVLSIVLFLLRGSLPRFTGKSTNSQKTLFISLFAIPISLLIVSIAMGQLSLMMINIISIDFVNVDALQKTLGQSVGYLGVLFGGRSEIFSSFLAWLDKPIWGWGSWAADSNDYYNLGGKILMNYFGYDLDINLIAAEFENVGTDGLIPTHSVLLNLLVWAGTIGFIPAYISVCKFILNGLEAAKKDESYSYPYLFACSLCLWFLLFSPFGYSNRLNVTFLMAVSIAWFLGVWPGHFFPASSSSSALATSSSTQAGEPPNDA